MAKHVGTKRNMNKVVTSAGLLALGAATVYGLDPEMTRATSGRPFTLGASVRAFYDDNSTGVPDRYLTTDRKGNPTVGRPIDSFGFEVSPSVHLNLPLEQTFIRAGYVYSLRYYENRRDNNVDQSHEFNALLRHAFNARHDIAVADSFTFSDEPTVTERFGIITAPARTDITAMRNRASVDYNATLTQVLGLGLGYVNNWYDYDDSGAASRSALLDRLEHSFRADLRYQVDPALVALVGYEFGVNQYTGDEFIHSDDPDAFRDELVLQGLPFGLAQKISRYTSDIRDSYSHKVYVGVDHDFNHRLRATVRVGGQFTDYHEIGETELSPYADAALTYVYMPESSVQVGVRHTRNATDIVSTDKKGRPTLDQETTAGFLQVTHRICGNLSGSLIGQVQHSTFSSGENDDQSENLYLLGINFDYRINRHWSAEVGYNYDMLDSSLDDGKRLQSRSYDRNRVYVGVRATY